MIKQLLILFLVCFLLLMPLVSAQEEETGDKLKINSLEVRVDGKLSTVAPGKKIRTQALPGSDIEFSIEVQNTFSKIEKTKIKEIVVEVILEDLNEEKKSQTFLLLPEQKKIADFSYEFPIYIKEGSYNLLIAVRGLDSDGNLQSDTRETSIKIAKKDYDATLKMDSEVRICDPDIEARIVNTGKKDIKNVEIKLENEVIGSVYKNTFEELNLKPGTSKKILIDIEEKNFKMGSYLLESALKINGIAKYEYNQIDIISCTKAVSPLTGQAISPILEDYEEDIIEKKKINHIEPPKNPIPSRSSSNDLNSIFVLTMGTLALIAITGLFFVMFRPIEKNPPKKKQQRGMDSLFDK